MATIRTSKNKAFEISRRFTFDYSEYEYTDFRSDNLNTARGEVNIFDVNVYECNSTYALYFKTDDCRKAKGWVCRAKDYESNAEVAQGVSSGLSLHIRSRKALCRWVRKMEFPVGTELVCDTGWVGSIFYIYCK